jgi:hypothetical protein
MKKQQVVACFCELASSVGNKVFKNKCAHDCFCGLNPLGNSGYSFDEDIIKYIEDAVNEKIARDIETEPVKASDSCQGCFYEGKCLWKSYYDKEGFGLWCASNREDDIVDL